MLALGSLHLPPFHRQGCRVNGTCKIVMSFQTHMRPIRSNRQLLLFYWRGCFVTISKKFLHSQTRRASRLVQMSKSSVQCERESCFNWNQQKQKEKRCWFLFLLNANLSMNFLNVCSCQCFFSCLQIRNVFPTISSMFEIFKTCPPQQPTT